MLKGGSLIITGASMGFGRALAEFLGVRGVNLVLNARGESQLEETWQLCDSVGIRAVAMPGDASKSRVAAELVEAAVQLGNFAGFIHSAAVAQPGPLAREISERAFDEVFDANVKAGWQLARHAIPVLETAGRGLAVFVGSQAAEVSLPGFGVYCASKAAEEHLARQIATETPWLTCFVYRPGIMDTRIQEQARNARGGASEQLKNLFRPWKERGQLTMPEVAAATLAGLVLGDWDGLSGKTIEHREKTRPAAS